ncbi:YojF family protein [Bacillus fonticola]|uniref:YojF family protein n=1 Tax=Bacillus fonticola TaxID=2728853 RepID=UPI0014728A90|nr:YojF family protein [Bacillus fonticola]
MKPITTKPLQQAIDAFQEQEVYIHLETTNGAYATHHGGKAFSAGAYIRNAKVRYEYGRIAGDGPFRIGLKLGELGWVYAEGCTHFEMDDQGRLLVAGHDDQGKLAVALQLSLTPFE